MTAPAVPTAPAAPTAAPAPRTVRRRPWGSTVIALVILAVLLFPVYWMVNVSLQEHATSFS
ncbi:carbohydrate ABC transporter permease, partial [Streptomyces sp. NPDC001054]